MNFTRRLLLGAALAGLARPVRAAEAPSFTFESIDGGPIDTAEWRGKPVLVVNTASLCGFAPQFETLQQLQDRYAAQGLVVLAVPSNDFRQELATGAEVKQYCEVNFGLTLQMTAITHVKGEQAHPFYRWMAEAHGFTPGWNFNKVLIGPDGQPRATWGSTVGPMSDKVLQQVEAALG